MLEREVLLNRKRLEQEAKAAEKVMDPHLIWPSFLPPSLFSLSLSLFLLNHRADSVPQRTKQPERAKKQGGTNCLDLDSVLNFLHLF